MWNPSAFNAKGKQANDQRQQVTDTGQTEREGRRGACEMRQTVGSRETWEF